MCGLLFNRGRFIVTLVMIPLVFLYAFADSILIGLGQDPAVSAVAKTFVCIMLPGIWAMGQFDATKKFLSSQQISYIPVITQVFTTILHLILCLLFIR